MSHSHPTQPSVAPPKQVVSPKSPSRDSNGDVNVRNRVKKVHFVGQNVDQLKDLFMIKFKDERENVFGFTKNTLPPFYLVYPNTTIKFELENVSDLYENAVLEIRADEPEKKGTSAVKNSVLAMRKLGLTRKLVVVMVGLPARGKTYIARKVTRYLNWLGIYTKVFNVGQYRRSRLGAEQDHHFFDPDNEEGRKARLHMAIAALDDMIEWLLEGGVVGIYDATNSTDARRCKRENMEVLFIESTCEDPEVIERNIKDTKLNSPDYVNSDPAAAVEDFKNRISHYAKTYETITDESLSYVQIIDIGRKVIVNRVNSYLASRIVFFLMNIHTHPRKIFLTRHGQSDFNAVGKIGGDSNLTKLGDDYAHLLAEWVNKNMPPEKTELVIFTSSLQRTIQTTQYIPARKIRLKSLDEIDAGEYDGMTYEEIAALFPEEYEARAKDKLGYKYPRGESYLDVIQRLETVIFQIERQQCDVLVVSHQAVLRCLLAYFMDLEIEECPFVDIPLHNIIQLNPKAYGCDKENIKLIPSRAKDTDN